MHHYSSLIEIKHPIDKVFQAISNELDHWWGEQSMSIHEVNIDFRVSWGEAWYEFKVIKFLNNEEMIWECTDANQIIKGLKNVSKEWLGSSIHWRLTKFTSSTTILEFEHKGLTPELECFDFCSNSWDHFLEISLVTYLNNA